MPRVYVRKFDHDEARRLFAAGQSVSDLAERFGVTYMAIARVVRPEYREIERRAQEAYEERHHTECEVCGARCLALTHSARRAVDNRELCLRCRADERRERLLFDDDGALVAVRCAQFDCANGERWQPPEHFTAGTRHREVRAGGIHGLCRACQTRMRRDYRRRHRAESNAYDREYKRRKREASRVQNGHSTPESH